MKKTLYSLFFENRLLQETPPSAETPKEAEPITESPSTAPSQKETAQSLLIAPLEFVDLTEKIKNKKDKIQLTDELTNNLRQASNNEFTLINNEIKFSIPLENDESVERSFILRGDRIFAELLVEAIDDRNSNRIKYLCYKYLRDLYRKPTQDQGLKRSNDKIGLTNIKMDEFIRGYEEFERRNQNTNGKTSQSVLETSSSSFSIAPEEDSVIESTQTMTELERTQKHGQGRGTEIILDNKGNRLIDSQVLRTIEQQEIDAKALKMTAQGEFERHSYTGKLAGFSKKNIIKNYDNLTGSRGITSFLQTKSRKIDKNKASEIIADTIHSSTRSNNFTEEELFDTLNKHEVLNYQITYQDLAKKLLTLRANQTNQELADFIFVRELSDKLRQLNYDEKIIENRQNTEGIQEEFSEDEKTMIKNLEKLFGKKEPSSIEYGSWEKFVAYFNGAKDAKELTMRQADGKTMFINEDIFTRNTNPDSAINILINNPEIYTIDSQNKPKILWYKLEQKINTLIKKGFAQEVLTRYPDPDEQETYLNSAEFARELVLLNVYGLGDTKTFSAEQKKYLQLGYLLERTEIEQKETREAKEISETHSAEYWREFEKLLEEEKVAPKIIEEIKSEMLLATGTSIVFKDGKFDRIEGFGIGNTIELSDGYSLSLGLATDGKDIGAGAGLSINLYKDGKSSVSFSLGLGSGGNLGAMLSAETGNQDYSIGGGIGVGINFATGTIMLGGNIEVGFKIEGNMQRRIERYIEKSPFFEVFQRFIETNDVDEKHKILMSIPGIEKTARNLQAQFNLTNEDIVNMIEMMENQIIEEAIKDTSVLDSSIPILHKVGVAFAGPIPIPYISFYLGTAEVFIPNRKEISHLRDIKNLRQANQDDRIEKALKEAEESQAKAPHELRFSQSIKEVTYTMDGEFAVIEESRVANLSTGNRVAQRLDAYNEALRRVEIGITKHENNKTELLVHNTRGKDIEIFIDPTLTDLALVKDGNRFCIEGNLEALVITRDRYNLPYKYNETSSNVRDVITIRKAGSLEGERSRDWIESQTTGTYISKKDGQGYTLKDIGTDRQGAWYQNNLLEINGYIESPDYKGETKADGTSGLTGAESLATGFAKQRSEAFSEIPQENLDRISALEQRAQNSLGLISEQEFEKRYPVRGNLNTEIREKMKQDTVKAFISKNINDTDILRKMVSGNDFMYPNQRLHNNEITEAISIIQDEYFSQIYKDSYDKLDQKRANQKIAKELKVRKERVFKKVLNDDIKETLLNRMGKSQAEADRLSKQYTDKILYDTIDPLIFQLENNPNFDFRELQVSKILRGSVFYSATRSEVNGKNEYVSTITDSKRSPESAVFLLQSGLLEVSKVEYPLNSEIGQVLLNLLNPIEGLSPLEFMKNPLSRKILAFTRPMIEIFGESNYSRLIAMIETPEILNKLEQSSPDYATFLKFQEFVQKLRKAQTTGQTFRIKIEKSPTRIDYVEIDIKGEIIAGAFSKCANSSFTLLESIEMRILDKDNFLVASEMMSHNSDTVTSSLGKAALTLTGAAAIINEDLPPPPRRDEGKQDELGPGKKQGSTEGKQNNSGPGNDIVLDEQNVPTTTSKPVEVGSPGREEINP
jgi:hypothetical protein